jgi:hypothetical protein
MSSDTTLHTSGFGQPPGGPPPGPPPGGGGFGAPPGGGGFGAPPPSGGGGFGTPPPGGGFGAPPPGGGFGAPPGPGGFAGGGPGPGPNPGVIEKVKTPALILLIVTGLGMLLQVVGAIMNLVGGGGYQYSADPEFARYTSGPAAVVGNVVALAIGGFIIFGLLKMMKGQSWGLSLAAVILGAIPCCGPCWCLGLPIGIWALVVLMNNEVKAGFTS